MTLNDESRSLEGVQYAIWEEWRTTTNSSRKKRSGWAKWEWLSIRWDSDESKIQGCENSTV